VLEQISSVIAYIFDLVLKSLGALVVIYGLLWVLARISELAERIYLKFANVLYALGERFNKSLQKNRIRGRLRELMLGSESEFVKSFEYDLDVEWSEKDTVEVDLEKSRITFRKVREGCSKSCS